MTEYSFTHYLAAKRSVDDRALNASVWKCLEEALRSRPGGAPLRVLEIGAGTGSMVRRVAERELFGPAEYAALDAAPENLASARQELQRWALEAGYPLIMRGDGLLIQTPAGPLDVCLQTADLFDFIRAQGGQPGWDLLLAHAFLDLVDLPRTLPLLRELVVPGGWFFFTINFDGLTLLEPPTSDPGLDEQILLLYHRSMDERGGVGETAGGSRSGRVLFHDLRQAGLEILAAGSSDWVVFANEGVYPADEAYFLRHILHFFEQSLDGRPELMPGRLQAWLAERRAQIEKGELVYIAHQLDFLARRPV